MKQYWAQNETGLHSRHQSEIYGKDLEKNGREVKEKRKAKSPSMDTGKNTANGIKKGTEKEAHET